MKEFIKLSIDKNSSILSALERMDMIDKKLLIILEKNRFFSLLSIGDIQRAIIAKYELQTPVYEIVRQNVRVAYAADNIEKVKARMRRMRTEFMPILNERNEIINIIYWEDLFKEKQITKLPFKVPVVIMAGGEGTRLKPITNILPKPLIPISSKTIIEEIMDRFLEVGSQDFYLSVNYKAELIRHYFKTLNHPIYNVQYFQEDKPLGTAGSLFLLKEKIDTTFFVTNCDIIIDQDLNEVYKYHKNNNNLITIISIISNYKIPYGTIETNRNGMLKKIIEKPNLTFQINSGMYILEPEVIEEIPQNKFLHITELIENIVHSGKKVGVFPVNMGSWKDIGDWSTYLKSQNIYNA